MGVTAYSTVAANNTTISSIPLGENAMAPSDVNNAFRQLLADIANGIADGDFASTSGLQPLDATLTALAAVTTAANKLIYATGADTFATTDLTSFGRTLVGLADYAALRTGLGAVTITASSLANPGYVKFNISGTDFTIQWGTATIGSNGNTSVSYPTAFSTFSIPVISAARTNANAQDNNPAVSSAGLTSFNAYSAADQNLSAWWIAVGV